MLQSAFNAVFRYKRSDASERPAGEAEVLTAGEADLVSALQRTVTDPVPEPLPIPSPVVSPPPAAFRPTERLPPELASTAELRAQIRIGAIEVVRIYNSGTAEIAVGYPELTAAIGERPRLRLCGPELADHLIARCVGKLERFNVVIDWAQTAATQKEWQTRQANLHQEPRDPARTTRLA